MKKFTLHAAFNAIYISPCLPFTVNKDVRVSLIV